MKRTVLAVACAVAALVSRGIERDVSAQTDAPSDAVLASMGFAINTQCQAGSCPPSAAQPSGTTLQLPIDFVYTAGNSDLFQVTGLFESRNTLCPGSFGYATRFVVQYLGNAEDTPSRDDFMAFNGFAKLACQPRENTGFSQFTLFGRFSPDIAPTSEASGIDSMNGRPLAVHGMLKPPGIFSDAPLSVGTIQIVDVLDIRDSVVAHFGSGSPVGSFIA
jgi:hypothetical protein